RRAETEHLRSSWPKVRDPKHRNGVVAAACRASIGPAEIGRGASARERRAVLGADVLHSGAAAVSADVPARTRAPAHRPADRRAGRGGALLDAGDSPAAADTVHA